MADRQEGGVAGGRGGPGGGHMENCLPAGAPCCLVNTLGHVRSQKRCHPSEEWGQGRGVEEAQPAGEGGSSVAALGGMWLSPRGLWTGKCPVTHCNSGHQRGLGGAGGRGRQGFLCLTILGLSGPGGDREGQQGRALGAMQVTDRAQCLMRAGHCPCLPFLKSQSSEVLPGTREPSRRKEVAGASFMPQGQRGPLKTCQAGSHLLRFLIPNPSWAGMGAGPQSTAEPFA